MTDRKDKIKNITIIFLLVMLILTFFSNTIMNYSLPEVSATYAQNGSVTAKVRGTGTVETAEDYDVKVTENHVVSLRCDRGSSYKAYMAVQNELVAAYNELRDELAQEKWQKNYVELDQEQQDAIRDIYPQRISEAEPKKYGEKK